MGLKTTDEIIPWIKASKIFNFILKYQPLHQFNNYPKYLRNTAVTDINIHFT